MPWKEKGMLDVPRKHIARATMVACALVATGGALAVPSTQFSVTGGAIARLRAGSQKPKLGIPPAAGAAR